MTRASFLITVLVSAAVAAQQPALPLPASDPNLPLPGAAAKPEAKKESAKKDSKEKKKEAAPPPLPLPAIDLSAKPAQAKPLPPLPLPELDAPPAKPAEKAAENKPAPAPAPAATPPAAPPRPAPTTTTLKATPAATRPSVSADRPPLATPMGSQTLQLGEMRLRPDFNSQLWNVRGFIGGERSSEEGYTESASLSRLGVEATRWFSGTWIARGELDWRSSTQAYVPLHSASNSPVRVDENRFDVLATLGYDVGPKLSQSGRLELTPMLGVAYMAIRNQAFPSDLIGPNLGGRVRYALSSSVIAHATIGYTFNLAVASTQNSALKSPKGDFNTRAGLSLPLSGGFALELDYSGDVLAFENTFRVAHGAALGFGTSF